MVNCNVRKIVDKVVSEGSPLSAEELYKLAQQIANHLVDDCYNLCMEDYKNQGNYGAGYRLANQIKEKFSS